MRSDSKKENNVPVWEKYVLTVDEACDYFGIGSTAMRHLCREYPNSGFLLMNGVKYLIKRKKFEEFIDEVDFI